MRVALALLSILVGAGVWAVTALMWGGILSGAPRLGFAVEIDHWLSDWSIGSSTANPYTRARVARSGLFALNKDEAVYFTRNQDDAAERLSETCTYRVSGGKMPAEWWSITLYDSDSMLPANTDSALSFDATTVESQSDMQSDNWEFILASTPPVDGEAWVSSRNAGHYDLTLRLYRPSAELLEDPQAKLVPPQIENLGCEDAS